MISFQNFRLVHNLVACCASLVAEHKQSVARRLFQVLPRIESCSYLLLKTLRVCLLVGAGEIIVRGVSQRFRLTSSPSLEF
jgi:hypothetical protein